MRKRGEGVEDGKKVKVMARWGCEMTEKERKSAERLKEDVKRVQELRGKKGTRSGKKEEDGGSQDMETERWKEEGGREGGEEGCWMTARGWSEPRKMEGW